MQFACFSSYITLLLLVIYRTIEHVQLQLACRKEARAVDLMERISNETQRAVTLVPVIKIKNCAS